MNRGMMFKVSFIIFGLIILGILLLEAEKPAVAQSTEATTVGAPWIDANWHYRRLVTVSNSASAQTNYQVLVVLDSTFDFSHANADGSDLRVTADDGITQMPFWVEAWDGTKAWIWVKVPSLPGGTDIYLYLYYGNPTATSISDGVATFEAYDGFESYAVGTSPTGNYSNPGEWTRYVSNPVLNVGALGRWDASGSTFASVIYDASASPPYRMYYHGWGTIVPCTGSCIGLATSSDGLTWNRYGSNPIMTPTVSTWDANGVRVPMVWKEGTNDYRMIYTGSGSGGLQIGYATSTDGITWIKHSGNPVFNDPTWAHGSTENWGVIKVGTQYLMWYSDLSTPRESGIAVSTDLINWTPYSSGPIFSTNGIPSDDRYSQFCPFTFTYGGYYYVLVPSYSSISDYSRYYLYRSSSPYFPESDRHLVRVAHTVGTGSQWDALDTDTPAVLTSDIERSSFPGNQLWTYYAGASSPGGIWREGLLIETDIAAALTDAPLPSGLRWDGPTGVSVVDNPVRSGLRSVQLNDISGSINLNGYFTPIEQGVLGAWMRVSNITTAGDYDLYAYGPSSVLAALGGFGRYSFFHYWNKNPSNPPGGYGTGFHDLSVSWTADTWYLITLVFNTSTDRYNLVIFNQNLTEIARQDNIVFGNAISRMSSILFNTSSTFVGRGYVDDFRLRKYILPEPSVTVGNYVDIQETVSISGTGPLTFAYMTIDSGFGVSVDTQGTLSDLQVVRYAYHHPNSTLPLQTGRYWEMHAVGAGYSVSLTLPWTDPDDQDKVCFWTGSGTLWNCAMTSYGSPVDTVMRSGITELSDWAVGDNAGPTAVTLVSMKASSESVWITPVLIGLGLTVGLSGLGWFTYRRMRKA